MSLIPPPQVVINGIIIGSIYALIAIGYSLVYNQLKFINFFHGALYLISAYLIYFFTMKIGVEIIISSLITASVVVSLNLIVTKHFFLRYVNKKNSKSFLLIISFILLILIQNIIILFFDSNPKFINFSFFKESLSLSGIKLSVQNLIILTLVSGSFVLFYIFMNMTRLGLEITAVCHSRISAELKGINSEMVILLTSSISAIFATVAGLFITMQHNIEPNMGFSMVFKGITATIIGGNKVYGAILGAFLIGVMENLSIWYFPSGYKNLVTFLILITFMYFLPHGIFSTPKKGDDAE